MRRRTGEDAAVDRRTCVHQEVQRVDDLHGVEESGAKEKWKMTHFFVS